MKKRKIKLFASLTSLVMVVAVMAVGIWAATSATFGVKSNASFTISAVQAKVAISTNDTNQQFLQDGTETPGITWGESFDAAHLVAPATTFDIPATATTILTVGTLLAQNATVGLGEVSLTFTEKADVDGFLRTAGENPLTVVDENTFDNLDTVVIIFTNTQEGDVAIQTTVADQFTEGTEEEAGVHVGAYIAAANNVVTVTYYLYGTHTGAALTEMTGPEISFNISKAA